jgi:hypothetical protein
MYYRFKTSRHHQAATVITNTAASKVTLVAEQNYKQQIKQTMKL